ncbi:unnamed protein product [Cuscuta epithymum]|uniref:Uncharacterized protein n=1 Tax=Cuscuta epithymum TaxID=186058 RepID=A0AAV0FK59_9ASTE|nr:unnamed protein product [Cuscuta epithymum]
MLNIGKTDSFKAELLGTRQGLLESIIQALKNKDGQNANSMGILVWDCQKLLTKERFNKLQHTFREGNKYRHFGKCIASSVKRFVYFSRGSYLDDTLSALYGRMQLG